jgi:hypothetical protein
VKSPLSLPLLLNGVLGHALFVGLPIALAARRITNQSSFSTQAAYHKAGLAPASGTHEQDEGESL